MSDKEPSLTPSEEHEKGIAPSLQDIKEAAEKVSEIGWDIDFDICDNHDGSIKVMATSGEGGNHNEYTLGITLSDTMDLLDYTSINGIGTSDAGDIKGFINGTSIVEGVFIKNGSNIPATQQPPIYGPGG